MYPFIYLIGFNIDIDNISKEAANTVAKMILGPTQLGPCGAVARSEQLLCGAAGKCGSEVPQRTNDNLGRWFGWFNVVETSYAKY